MKLRVFAVVAALLMPPAIVTAQDAPTAKPAVDQRARAAADALGMVRGIGAQESLDYLNRIQYGVEGEVHDVRKSGAWPAYKVKGRVGISLLTPASRIEVQRTGSDGRAVRVVEVVNGSAAWDESQPGTFARAAMASARDRQRDILMSPQGFVRALVRARPADVKWAEAGGRKSATVVVDGVPLTATMNADGRPETLAMTDRHAVLGPVTFEASFSDYKDIDFYGVMFPTRIVRKVAGRTVADLKVTDFHTGPYLVFPIPESLRRGAPAAPEPERPVIRSDAPTPRMADGKPDLNGMWNGNPPGVRGGEGGLGRAGTVTNNVIRIVIPARDGDISNFENDSFIRERATQDLPLYKPEFWDRVQEIDRNGNTTDPVFSCMPAGVPRMGAPLKMVRTDKEVILFHSGGSGPHPFRIIPITGNDEHSDDALINETWLGDSVARWEGDTLVIDSRGFNEQSWFGSGGYIHTYQMHVVERLTRQGDAVLWEATVEDPNYLEAPFHLEPRVLWINRAPGATIAENPPCSERDLEAIQTGGQANVR